MATVYKAAEWSADVEEDAFALAKAVQWSLRGLIRRCEDCGVEPVGNLTVTCTTLRADGEYVGPVRAYSLALELHHMHLPRQAAFGVRCIAFDCMHSEFGFTEQEAIDRVLKHWEGAHAAGEDHWRA